MEDLEGEAMTWQEYVSWTDETALPVASNPAYLVIGLAEELHELDAALSAIVAVDLGNRKRALREGLAEADAKHRLGVAKQRIVAELGDSLWYLARLCRVTRAIGVESRAAEAMSAFGTPRNREDLQAEMRGWRRVAEAVGHAGPDVVADLMDHSVYLLFPTLAVLWSMCELVGGLELVLEANRAKLLDRQKRDVIRGAGDVR
jgi:hypothetical protein